MIDHKGTDLPVYALVLAGGSGRRMTGIDLPKQYLELEGKPVIIHSVMKFLNCPQTDRVIIVCPESYIEYTEGLVGKFIKDPSRVSVTSGGPDRNASLMNGLEEVIGELGGNDDAVVLTHDAARPFVTEGIIEENIAAAAEYGACATVIPATDTIMRSDDGRIISEIPRRSHMYQAQTPQSFRLRVLYDAMNSMSRGELAVLTDACGIMQAKGVPVHIVFGENTNIKLTYPQDMYTAEGIIKVMK